MMSFRSVLSISLLLVVASSRVQISWGQSNPCRDGSTCCNKCQKDCKKDAAFCFLNCKASYQNPECISYPLGRCLQFGSKTAKKVADAACAETIAECGLAAASPPRKPSRPVNFSQGDCCIIVSNSCAGKAERIPCNPPKPGNFGTCSAIEFTLNYAFKVGNGCKTNICKLATCGNVLAETFCSNAAT